MPVPWLCRNRLYHLQKRGHPGCNKNMSVICNICQVLKNQTHASSFYESFSIELHHDG